MCDVVKNVGKEEYLSSFIHIGTDWINIHNYLSQFPHLLRFVSTRMLNCTVFTCVLYFVFYHSEFLLSWKVAQGGFFKRTKKFWAVTESLETLSRLNTTTRQYFTVLVLKVTVFWSWGPMSWSWSCRFCFVPITSFGHLDVTYDCRAQLPVLYTHLLAKQSAVYCSSPPHTVRVVLPWRTRLII